MPRWDPRPCAAGGFLHRWVARGARDAATVSGTAALITVIDHVIYRLFEAYLLNRRVLRKTVDVSPVVTVIAVLIGGALLGITGARIAVPADAAVQLILLKVIYPQRDAATALEHLDDAGEPGAALA